MYLRVLGMQFCLGLALIVTLDGCGANPLDGDPFADASVNYDPNENGRDSGVSEASDAGNVPEGPGVCAGKPGMLKDKVHASVKVNGRTRTFIYSAPKIINPTVPVPLVISPHGFSMNAEDMFTITRFKELADVEGFVAIFPDGNPIDPWNVGLGVSGAGALVNNPFADDQAFIDAMIDYAKADQCIDEKHIFLSGFSMGGYFSNEVGCVRSDIASIGPHSGGSHDLTLCTGSIKPVILFHGAFDLLITYDENALLTRNRWVARNGCSKDFDKVAVKGGHCDYYRGCPEHAQVALCHFDLMGHAWAGGVGRVNSDPNMASAAELAWNFWKEYAW